MPLNIDQQVPVPVAIGDASALEPVLGKDAGESDALLEGESEGGGGLVPDPTCGNGAGAKSCVLNLGKLGHVVDSRWQQWRCTLSELPHPIRERG